MTHLYSDQSQVVILWRSTSKTLSFGRLREGWLVNPDEVLTSKRHLDVAIEELLHHKKVLPHTVELPQLTDEHAQVPTFSSKYFSQKIIIKCIN